LRNMGIMTSDADHLYYVDAMANIYKENRQTGEKTKLGDASGLMLNVMDGWVYYKDGTTGNLCRISTDGATKEIVVETTNSILAVSVIGNEIYYIQSQPKKNLTPDLQELIAAGQMDPNTYHLYRLTVGSKKPKLVFKEDIKDLVYYKDRFYYLSDADGAVYSFDRQGKDQKKIASGPIYGFEIINDSLFYIDGTADEATKVPKLVLVRAETNGTYIEDIVNDKMVVNFIVDGEDIYYLAANQETGTVDLYKKSGSETTLVAEQCSELFNAKDGYILYLDSEGRLMKTKADKSGFEELELQLPAAN